MTLDDALLAFYRLTERFEGIPPTVREFQEELDLSSSSVATYWLDKLEKAELTYVPEALRRQSSGVLPQAWGARTRQLSKAGRQRAYLLTEAVA